MHFGQYASNQEFDNITLKLIEEMAELTQALIKYDKESKDVIQEVADVLITLNEYITILDPEELDETIDFKLNRTIERLKI